MAGLSKIPACVWLFSILLRFQMNCKGGEGTFCGKSTTNPSCSQLLPTQKNALRYQNKGMPNMTSLLIWSQPVAKVFSSISWSDCVCADICVVSGSGRQTWCDLFLMQIYRTELANTGMTSWNRHPIAHSLPFSQKNRHAVSRWK